LNTSWATDQPKIKVGISSCLLGMKVRFDGGHKHDNYITQSLGRYFDWVPVCPEVEIGMGTPRENIRLVGEVESPRLIGHKSGTDYTDRMEVWAEQRLDELSGSGLHGYILKKDSPSCGMERVRVYGTGGAPVRAGSGIFASALLKRFLLLPVEEEGRLNDLPLRENFIERVFDHHRLIQFLNSDPHPAELVRFHTRHKLTLMSHSLKEYKEMGQIVARAGTADRPALLLQYSRLFMQALRVKATRRKHVNVLYHILGFFKKTIDAEDKQELVEVISRYHQGYVPLIVPITLIRHHLRRYPVDWIDEQIYLNPYPAELMLRNFI
jgi:uncharacterized protein YbgA (DUF1722 family)/uncharacterized protein YbbK (DUF523 family)